MKEREGHLREETRRWVQDEADRLHNGVWGAAAAAILEAAHEAAKTPDDPWAYQQARIIRRSPRG